MKKGERAMEKVRMLSCVIGACAFIGGRPGLVGRGWFQGRLGRYRGRGESGKGGAADVCKCVCVIVCVCVCMCVYCFSLRPVVALAICF
jgi:hypothetical protein